MSSANLSLASTTSNHCSSPTTSTCSSLVQNISTSTSSSLLLNKWLEGVTDDKLYHFGLYKSDKDLKSKFGDVKFVCIGGSPGRLCAYAELFAKNMNIDKSCNLSHTDRFSMWKTGPVLWINHGMGVPSLSIMLVESIKLLHYAGATNFQFIRLGTSGGVGVTPGTIVVSNGAVNGLLEEKHIQYVKGEIGLTLCTDDFYEGQMRLDGLFCDYTDKDKHHFFNKLYQMGVKNIEMESTGFAAFTHRAGIPAAILCVAVVNRMRDDQAVGRRSLLYPAISANTLSFTRRSSLRSKSVRTEVLLFSKWWSEMWLRLMELSSCIVLMVNPVVVDKDTYHEFEMRPFQVVYAYIKECMLVNST